MKNNIPFVGGWAQWPKPHLITHRGVVVVVDTFSLTRGVVWWSSRSWLTCEVLTLGAGGGCRLMRDVWWRVVVEWLWLKREVLLLLLTGGGGVCRSMRVWEMVEGVENVALTVWTDLVTDPSPAKTGTGMLRVIFSSPVPIPVTPVPAIPHGFTFPCPSLARWALGRVRLSANHPHSPPSLEM